jgi:hypothetical protein
MNLVRCEPLPLLSYSSFTNHRTIRRYEAGVAKVTENLSCKTTRVGCRRCFGTCFPHRMCFIFNIFVKNLISFASRALAMSDICIRRYSQYRELNLRKGILIFFPLFFVKKEPSLVWRCRFVWLNWLILQDR